MLKTISIGEVSEILGVHNSTLRRWENSSYLLMKKFFSNFLIDKQI